MIVETIVIIAAVGLFAYGISRSVHRITVFEHEYAVRFDRGILTKLLSPGVFWIFTSLSTIKKLDARPQILTVPGQEVLSSDGVTLKVSVVVEYRIVDPKKAIMETSDYVKVLYSKVQTALRMFIGTKTIEDVLQSRVEISDSLRSAVSGDIEAVGLELNDIAVKDIMFPGLLKVAFSKTARAKHDAQAALEKARGEAASLRKLANAARILDENPNLFQLRLLQSASETGKLVLTFPSQELK